MNLANAKASSKSNFTSFSLPDGAGLPPKLIHLLPNISGSELKVLAAVLYIYIRVVKFFNQSGTQSVKKFNRSETQPVKNFYRSGPQSVKNFNQLWPESEESERELINYLSIKDSLSDSLNSESSKKFYQFRNYERAGAEMLRSAQHDKRLVILNRCARRSPVQVYEWVGISYRRTLAAVKNLRLAGWRSLRQAQGDRPG
jgi:hypothetical protein